MEQFCLKPLGIGLVFKAGADVIGIAHQDDVPSGMVANPPDEEPLGEVQQTVGDHRRAQLQHWGWPCRIWPTPPRRTLA